MPKTHILVVEDDDDARMMYTIMLRSWGYEITEATTGGEGIRAAQKHKPDLILLDVMMPDMDGYEVCRQLRDDAQFHRVPILFLTALDAMDDRIKGYTLGGDDFLTKGHTDYKELGARIEAALKRTRLLLSSSMLGDYAQAAVGSELFHLPAQGLRCRHLSSSGQFWRSFFGATLWFSYSLEPACILPPVPGFSLSVA